MDNMNFKIKIVCKEHEDTVDCPIEAIIESESHTDKFYPLPHLSSENNFFEDTPERDKWIIKKIKEMLGMKND